MENMESDIKNTENDTVSSDSDSSLSSSSNDDIVSIDVQDINQLTTAYKNLIESEYPLTPIYELLIELAGQEQKILSKVSTEREQFKNTTDSTFQQVLYTFRKAPKYIEKLRNMRNQMNSIESRVNDLKLKAVDLQNYATPHDIIPLPKHNTAESKANVNYSKIPPSLG
jgi:hypothetical protein